MLLTHADCEKIHQEALVVLDQLGVRVDDPETGAIKGASQMGGPLCGGFTDSHPSSVIGEWTKASKSYK